MHFDRGNIDEQIDIEDVLIDTGTSSHIAVWPVLEGVHQSIDVFLEKKKYNNGSYLKYCCVSLSEDTNESEKT